MVQQTRGFSLVWHIAAAIDSLNSAGIHGCTYACRYIILMFIFVCITESKVQDLIDQVLPIYNLSLHFFVGLY